MANIEPKQQILIRLIAISAADLALVWFAVAEALKSGASPFSATIRREEQPSLFWLSLFLVLFAGAAFIAFLLYAVLPL